VFTLRHISRYWPDATMRVILKHLRSAAQTSTKLIIVDNIVPYCIPTGGKFSDIPGAEVGSTPEPLLANLGLANGYIYVADLQVRNYLSS
jgi:hypothetical protein